MRTFVEQEMRVQSFSQMATGRHPGHGGQPREMPQVSHSLQGARPKRYSWISTEAVLWAAVCTISESDRTCWGS